MIYPSLIIKKVSKITCKQCSINMMHVTNENILSNAEHSYFSNLNCFAWVICPSYKVYFSTIE